MAKESKTTLGDILGKGGSIEVGGRTYKVLPLTLYEACGDDGDNGEFITDGLVWNDEQGYNVFPPEARANVDKWMQRKLRDDAGQPVTFKQATKDGWDFADVKDFLRKLAGISG